MREQALHCPLYCNELEEKAPRDFHKYFPDNRHACRHVWVHCWRGSSPHMGNQMTNRLESFHGKVKAYLHPNMTISNCVDELLHFDRRKEIQTTHEVIIVSSVKARYKYGEDSAITGAIQSIATPFAADIILHELEEARKIEATIANKDTNQCVRQLAVHPC